MGVTFIGVRSQSLAKRLAGLIGVLDGDCGKAPGISSLSWRGWRLVGIACGVRAAEVSCERDTLFGVRELRLRRRADERLAIDLNNLSMAIESKKVMETTFAR